MALLIAMKGQFSDTLQMYGSLGWVEIGLFVTLGVSSVLVQTLRYNAMAHIEPGKVAHYQYLAAVYSLLLDLFIF